MARLISGANGPFIGKAGAHIGYVVNGVGYIKGLYKKRTKPAKPGEIINRKKFAAAHAWLLPLIDFVRVGFKGYNERFQGFVAAKSWLMTNAITVTDGEIVIDPSLVKISYGNLTLPDDLSCTQEPEGLLFSWNPSITESIGSDQAMVLAYDADNCRAAGVPYGNPRYIGEQYVKIEAAQGKTFHVYLAFIASDRSRQSDSIYFGQFKF